MSWRVYLYQPLDTFPYEPAQIDLETAWTRIEILAELLAKPQPNLAIAYALNHEMTRRSNLKYQAVFQFYTTSNNKARYPACTK